MRRDLAFVLDLVQATNFTVKTDDVKRLLDFLERIAPTQMAERNEIIRQGALLQASNVCFIKASELHEAYWHHVSMSKHNRATELAEQRDLCDALKLQIRALCNGGTKPCVPS